MTSPSPTVRRRELGARLRTLRLAAGMTVEEVAAHMEVSQAKISRLETATRGVSVADVRFLCDLYAVSADDRERLLALTRQSRERSWWQAYGLPEGLATFVGLEDAAVSIHQYQTSLVPGLLQTEDYARAATTGIEPDWSVEQVDQVVSTRLTRQRLLTSQNPPEYWVVLDESALHYLIGDAGVMTEQLLALTESSRKPNITVQVIPRDAGAHPAMSSSFSVLQLEEVEDVVTMEGLVGHITLQSASDLRRFRRIFDQLRAVALSPRQTQLRLDSIAHDFAT